MGQFVDDNELRLPGECRINVKLQERVAAIGHGLARQNFEVGQQCRCFRPSVGFHNTNDNIFAFTLEALGAGQHGIGFADTR